MIRIVFTVLMIFFSNNLHAEVVKEITINGNVRVSSETVKVYGDIDINKDYTKEDKLSLIQFLFDVAYADKILEVSEERLIRRIADLINIKDIEVLKIKDISKNKN